MANGHFMSLVRSGAVFILSRSDEDPRFVELVVRLPLPPSAYPKQEHFEGAAAVVRFNSFCCNVAHSLLAAWLPMRLTRRLVAWLLAISIARMTASLEKHDGTSLRHAMNGTSKI